MYAAAEGSTGSLPTQGMPEGGPPRVVRLDHNISLVLSDVPASQYNARSLESKLSDLDWVAAAGAAHHGVIDALAAQGAVVLPFRLFTIFSSEQKAAATLRETLPAMTRAFDRVRGRQEWVLRIGKPDAERKPPEQATTSSSQSGTSFLAAKAAARRENIERAERIKLDAAASYDALERLADAAKARPVEGSGHLMLDAAFLVHPSRIDALKEALTRAAERLLRDGCAVSLTGPWPPYSFASIETNADG